MTAVVWVMFVLTCVETLGQLYWASVGGRPATSASTMAISVVSNVVILIWMAVVLWGQP